MYIKYFAFCMAFAHSFVFTFDYRIMQTTKETKNIIAPAVAVLLQRNASFKDEIKPPIQK